MTVPVLTKEQAAILGAFTGVLCGEFGDLHEYVERVMGRPVFTHEMGDRTTADAIKEAARADFMALLPSKVSSRPPAHVSHGDTACPPGCAGEG